MGIGINPSFYPTHKQLHVFRFKNKIKIIPLSDIHLGSPDADLDLVQSNIKYIKRRRNFYILGMGDWMDACLKTSLGNVYKQKISPDEQVDELYKMFKPVRKKILGLLYGNHEARVERGVNFNPMKILAKDLGVPFFGYSAMFKFVIGKQTYSVYATHGSSMARTIGGKLNALLRLQNVADCDLYLHAHVHDLLTFAQPKMTAIKNKIEQRKRYFCLTGHFLNYEDSYAERKNYQIGKKGVVRITLHSDKYDVHCSI